MGLEGGHVAEARTAEDLQVLGETIDGGRRLGRGRYSHWGRYIYFSSTDNTDPRKNGRSYKLVQRV